MKIPGTKRTRYRHPEAGGGGQRMSLPPVLTKRWKRGGEGAIGAKQGVSLNFSCQSPF